MRPLLSFRYFQPLAIASVWLCSVFVLLPSCLSQSASPQVIPFQGQVTNQQGQAVASGQYSIIFNLYDVAVGGQPIWTERHTKVGVVNGMVNVFLGSITSIATVDFSSTRYLGITVDVDDRPTTADPEMVPRQMIIPAFHAKTAETTRKMSVLDSNGVPVAGQNYGWSAVFNDGNPSSGRISGSKLVDGSIAPQQIADSAVGSMKLADGAVTTPKLADGAVTAPKMSTGVIGTPQILDGAVTLQKQAARSLVSAVGAIGAVVTSPVVNSEAEVELATTGRPVFVGLMGGPGNGDSFIRVIGPNPLDQLYLRVNFTRYQPGFAEELFSAASQYIAMASNSIGVFHIPPSSYWAVTQQAAGIYRYKIRIVSGGVATVDHPGVVLIAYEL